MVLHSEIGLLGPPGRSRSLPLPCPTRCSCCCHRSTSLPGARRGMLRWVRLCWDSWFSLRWTVLAFEQRVNLEWTGFVRICLWNHNISPTWKLWKIGFLERDYVAKFLGRMMSLYSRPTLPSINESCYTATTNKQGRGRRRPKWTLSMSENDFGGQNLMETQLSVLSDLGVGYAIIMNRTPYVR